MGQHNIAHGAANRARFVVTDYVPDPNGIGLFRGLAAVAQAGMDGRTGLVTVGDKGRPEASFNGYAARRQAFTGEAALASYGAAQPIKPGPGQFADSKAALDAFGNDLTLRIYAARARRHR